MGNMGQSGMGGNLLQMIMQRMAPLQQQNPQAYAQIMQRIQERLGQMPQQAFGGNAMGMRQQGMPQLGGNSPQGFPQQGMPQLAALQQQNPQVYQALLARMAGRPSPFGG